MKRNLLLIIGLLASFVVPASIFAYSNNFHFDMMGSKFSFNSSNDTSYYTDRYGMMGVYNSDFMNEMMAEIDDCHNQGEHSQYFEEQKQLIEDQLANGEITQEEADKLLSDLNIMIEYHNQYHSDDRSYFGCH